MSVSVIVRATPCRSGRSAKFSTCYKLIASDVLSYTWLMANAVAHATIPETVRERLEALARENDRSLAAEIRRALREHVERERAAEAKP